MLYVVATPVGNLGDITLRALEVLKGVDVVAAEDTRYSGLLLKDFEIKKPFVSYHEHNRAPETVEAVDGPALGEDGPWVPHAGTRGVSRPALRLIPYFIERALPFT